LENITIQKENREYIINNSNEFEKTIEKEYKYFEIVLNGITNRNRVISKDEFRDLWKSRNKDKDSYQSVFKFRKDFQDYVTKNGSVMGYNGLCFIEYIPIDIDDTTDLNKALNTARNLITHLESNYEIKKNIIKIYFSGSKGFHIFIPSILFDVKPSIDLPFRIKNLVKSLIPYGAVIDNKIYDKTRLIRGPNTKHPKSDLFKNPLSADELLTKSIKEIKKLAANPRDFRPWDTPTTNIEGLCDLYNKISSPTYVQQPGTSNIKEVIDDGNQIEEGNRNDFLFKAARRFIPLHSSSGLRGYIDDINSTRCFPPLGNDEVEGIIQSALKYNSPEQPEIPNQINKLMPFPIEVYPGKVQTIVKELSNTIGCPIDIIAGPMLGVFATAIGASRDVKVNNTWSEPSCLWIALILPSGQLKTPAFKNVRKPIADLKRESALQYAEAMKQYEEDKKEHDKKYLQYKNNPDSYDYPETNPELPKDKVLETNDVTKESMSELLSNNPRGLMLFMDELSGFVMSFDQYKGKGSDRQFYLELHNGNDTSTNRKGKATSHAFNPRATIMGGIPPDMLGELKGAFKEKEDGLVPRFLPVFPEPFQLKKEIGEVDNSIHFAYRKIVEGLYSLELEIDEIGPIPKQIELSKEAFSYFEERRKQTDDESKDLSFPPIIKPSWDKLHGQALRLALILHSLYEVCNYETEQKINLETMEKAYLLIEYFKGHIKKMYGGLSMTGRDKLIQRTVDYIKRKKINVTARTLQMAKIVEKSSEGHSLLEEMQDRGLGIYSTNKEFTLIENNSTSQQIT